MAESARRKDLDAGESRMLREVSRLVIWLGISLAIISPLFLIGLFVVMGSPVEMWRGTAPPQALGRAIVVESVVAAIAIMLGGLAAAAAGWGIGTAGVAHDALTRAERSLEAYAQAEKTRVRRFELLYGRIFEEVENLRALFPRAYVAIPGPMGTLMKVPVELGERRVIDSGLEAHIPDRTLDQEAWVPGDERRALMNAGVYTLRDLAAIDAEHVAGKTQVPEAELHRLSRVARLFSLPSMTTEWALWLVDAGVTSMADLVSRDPLPLARLAAEGPCRGLPEAECAERVEAFIEEGRRIWESLRH